MIPGGRTTSMPASAHCMRRGIRRTFAVGMVMLFAVVSLDEVGSGQVARETTQPIESIMSVEVGGGWLTLCDARGRRIQEGKAPRWEIPSSERWHCGQRVGRPKANETACGETVISIYDPIPGIYKLDVLAIDSCVVLHLWAPSVCELRDTVFTHKGSILNWNLSFGTTADSGPCAARLWRNKRMPAVKR